MLSLRVTSNIVCQFGIDCLPWTKPKDLVLCAQGGPRHTLTGDGVSTWSTLDTHRSLVSRLALVLPYCLWALHIRTCILINCSGHHLIYYRLLRVESSIRIRKFWHQITYLDDALPTFLPLFLSFYYVVAQVLAAESERASMSEKMKHKLQSGKYQSNQPTAVKSPDCPKIMSFHELVHDEQENTIWTKIKFLYKITWLLI